MNWHLESDTFDYRDYVLRLPDVNGHGGRLQLTFSLDDGAAHLTVMLDNMDEGCDWAEAVEHEIQRIPLAWANAIASGVDGYTMAPPAPVRRCACGYELRDYADTEIQCGACAAKEV